MSAANTGGLVGEPSKKCRYAPLVSLIKESTPCKKMSTFTSSLFGNVDRELQVGSLTLSGTLDTEALKLSASSTTSSVTMQAPTALASSYSLTLPPDDGVALQFLQTDGSGVTTWASQPGSTYHFNTRAAFVAGLAGFAAVADGTVVSAAGDLYRKSTGATNISDLPDWLPYNEVWVEHFGAVTVAGRANANVSSIDNTDAIQAAIDYVTTVFWGGPIYFRDNYYRVEGLLKIQQRGIYLHGRGDQETYLFADHTLGPVLQIMKETSEVHNMSIDASDTRRDSGALATTNYGILYQVDDIVGTPDRLQNSILSVVRIQNQPSHGLYISLTAYTGTVNSCWMVNNKGHGVLIDRGKASGMVNKGTDVSGLVTFNGCQVKNNEGNGFALGNPTDLTSTTQALRVIVNNAEIVDNASGVSARFGQAEVYLRGVTEFVMIGSVCSSDGVPGNSGVIIEGGRGVNLLSNRFISVDRAVLIDSNANLSTNGVIINGFNVISSPGMVEAVLVQNTTGDSSVDPRGIIINNWNFVGGIDTLVATGTGMDSGAGPWRVPEISIGGRMLSIPKLTTQTVNNSTTLVEDDHLKFWLLATETVTFTMVVTYQTSGVADFKLRMTGPAGSTLLLGPLGNVKVNTANALAVQNMVAGDVDIELGGGGLSTPRCITLAGTAVGGGTSGKVYLQWAQNTAEDTNTQVLAPASVLTIYRRMV